MDRTNYKNLIFAIYYGIVSILMAFPPFFGWANRIEPWVIGLPFSMFYLFLCVGLMSIGIIVQYIVEDKMGELDIDIDVLDPNELGEENK